MAISGEKFQPELQEEAIAKTLQVYIDTQEQKNESRYQAFLQEFRQTLSHFREEINAEFKTAKPSDPEIIQAPSRPPWNQNPPPIPVSNPPDHHISSTSSLQPLIQLSPVQFGSSNQTEVSIFFL